MTGLGSFLLELGRARLGARHETTRTRFEFSVRQRGRAPQKGTIIGHLLAVLARDSPASVSPQIATEVIGGGQRYDVKLLSGPFPVLAQRPRAGSTSIIVAKKDGKKYHCNLPSSTNATVAADAVQAPTPRVASFLRPLKGTCFYRLEGWWTYEFCFMKSLRQFHQEKHKSPTGAETTQVTQEYFLGRWSQRGAANGDSDGHGDDGGGSARGMTTSYGNAASADELGVDAKNRKSYWSQWYADGTMCDLPGYKKPRETEVRLQCSLGEPSFLASVEEVSTCKYVVHFSTNLLCKHPGFVADETRGVAQLVRCEALAVHGGPLPRKARAPKNAAHAQGTDEPLELDAGSRVAGIPSRGATPTANPARKAEAPTSLFDIGECMVHLKYNYRGVIVGLDDECKQSESWMRTNGVGKLSRGWKQPFYHVLPDTRDRPGAPVYYVAHENVLADSPPEPPIHPLVRDFFDSFDTAKGCFVPTLELRKRYSLVAGRLKPYPPAGGATADNEGKK